MLLQGAADARRRVRRRTFVLQVLDNTADAVLCERLPNYRYLLYHGPIDAHRSSVRDKEKVKMKRVGGEWKVVVTDKLYDVLTGKGK